jgi:hypothetical protein
MPRLVASGIGDPTGPAIGEGERSGVGIELRTPKWHDPRRLIEGEKMNIFLGNSPRAGCGGLVVAAAFAFAVCHAAVAQTVYRCEVSKGRVSYSNEPCMGAKVVDTTPTQGLDKSSGESRKGSDVQREQLNKSFHDAIRPVTGKSHEEMKVAGRRHKLSISSRLECEGLDERLAAQEAEVSKADAQSREQAEAQLFLSRSRYRNLGC